MKTCKECNVAMRKGRLFGEPFKMDMDHDIDDFFVRVENGTTIKTLFGTMPGYDQVPLEALICPNCGKVELYIDPNKLS